MSPLPLPWHLPRPGQTDVVEALVKLNIPVDLSSRPFEGEWPAMQSEPNTPQTPFQVNVADRVKRLPPYLFGKINALKYAKRRAGIDVIDLGMGNPSDVPDPQVIDKLCEAARDERNHRYSVSNGLANLRREVALRYERRHGVTLDPETEVIAGLGSKEVFSHMCLALLGPGDTAVVPAPSFPDPRLRGGAGLGQRHQPRLHASRTAFCRTWP